MTQIACVSLLVLCFLQSFCDLFSSNVVVGAHKYSNTTSHRSHRFQRRRAADLDDRFVGFHFVEEPKNVVARDGRAQLHCRHSVSLGRVSAVRIEWRKDGASLSSLRPSGRVLVLQSGTLIIENVVAEDEGVYQCVVHVTDKHQFTWTFLSQRASIKLPTLSRFEVQPQDRVVYRGQSVAFSCVLSSLPPVQIEWYLNDKPIVESADTAVVIYPVSWTLEIMNVQPHHEGSYKCVAKNGGKMRTSAAGYLKIRPENNVGSEFAEPYFVLEPRGNVVEEDESIILECIANGWPKPDIRWLKGSETISFDSERIRRIGSSSLLIAKASEQDEGVYTCRASNSHESIDTSATIQIKVAPKIVKKPKDYVAQETMDAVFECETTGKPGASISWYKNGEAIIASEYFVIEASRLRVLGLVRNDQGVYQCIAENDAGCVQSSAQLIVENADTFSMAGSSGRPRVPSEPLGLRTSTIGSRFVTLLWDPPVQRFGSVLAYHVFFKEKGSDRERMLNSSQTSITVTPLQPNTVYLFRMVAENEAGMGRSTLPILITTTKEQAVPGKVKDLRAVAVSPETIEVSWNPPNGSGPKPVQYKLFYIRKNAKPDEKETEIVMKKTNYALHGMERYEEYTIRVEAEGVNGAGMSSTPVIVRTLSDVPSMPPETVRAEATSSTSILVEWEPPPATERNGIITGYRIKYKTKQRGAKVNTLVVDGNDLSHTINALDPGAQYMIRLSAVNQNGSGPNSEWIHVSTPLEDKDEGQVAGPPMSLKVQPASDSIQLSWLPPRDEGVMIRGYLIGWGINIPDVEQTKVASNFRHYTIKGLKPGRDYVISLRAYNLMGNGFPIYETVRTSIVGSQTVGTEMFDSHESSSSSTTPIGVHAESLSQSSMRITWTDPDHLTPYSRQYTIRYNSNAENGGHYRYLNTSDTEAIIEGLRPNTQYEFAVKVNAGRVSSAWSMTAVNKTQPAPPSSAPRDLTVVQPYNGDPTSLTLNWQPPKHANGDIQEYLIFYSDRPDLPDKDWILDGVKGDRLSITLTNLLPQTSYFIKIQARNVKGYGPMSPVLQYVPGAPPPRMFQTLGNEQKTASEVSLATILSNPSYVFALGSMSLVIIISCISLVFCVRIKRGKSTKAGGYVAGRKSTAESKGPPDLWIDQNHGQHVRAKEVVVESPVIPINGFKRMEPVTVMPDDIDSPPPRYQTLQDLACHPVLRALPSISISSPYDNLPRSRTSLTIECESATRRRLIGRARPIPVASVMFTSDSESNGTLSRSYHQSSSSLEGLRRTPQVVYTGSGRQPLAKIDYLDQGSAYGSSQALRSPTPPQLPNQGPPLGPPGQLSDGYRTLRGVHQSPNPLKSFTQLAGGPPPISPSHSDRVAHIVRPVIVPSPNVRGGKPAGIVIGQKSSQVPVGRATAQPRVNVNSIYSSYASCNTSQEKVSIQRDSAATENKPLQPSNSTEELNAQMENLDTMIDDLQALQHEFTAST